VPNTQRYENFEGIVATDSWFGPLFTNIRLKVTNAPVTFHRHYPMFQVQPILRECYSAPSYQVLDFDDLEADDWQRFAETMMPNADQYRRLGHYAAATRRKLRREPAAP
jgi:hypothetical protein